MKLTIDDDAQEETRQQVAWYAARNPDAASRHEDLIVATVERIARNPFEFPLMEIPTNAGDTRRARLTSFPLATIYQLLDDEVLIVAVAHTSRRPDYWRYRLRK